MRKSILEGLESLRKAKDYSIEKLKEFQADLEIHNNSHVSVITVGSYARGEASDQSDIDYYVIYDDKYVDSNIADDIGDKVREYFTGHGIRLPSSDGAFNEAVKKSDLLVNIGGNDDTNMSLTRRMLYLLESEWLTNEEFYKNLINEMVSSYVKEGITQHTMCRFFLNDLVRYYRTMCVDFEYKTCEKGKSWGDRNIKLLFSRKLIYFSGLITVAETVQHTCESKRSILIDNFSLRPIDRILKICGGKSFKSLKMYNEFLSEMSSSNVRNMLNSTCSDRDKHSVEFRDFKNKGHHFSWELARLFEATYGGSHPIHHAIMF